MNNKPSIFIGSSSEGLCFARPIRSQLEDAAEISLWNEGFFKLGNTFIETLVNALPRFDFAILVLTPDDLIKSRNDEAFGPRDNIIFELGLFMGSIGRSRTFVVHQADAQVKIPSDLSGVTTAKYQWPRQDANFDAAVGGACDAMRRAIRDLGVAEHRVAERMHEVAKEQERQAKDIDNIINMLVKLVLSEHERQHLRGLAADGRFPVDIKKETLRSFENEIRRLIALRLIGQHAGTRVSVFFSKEGRKDAKEFFFITESGREYLKFHQLAKSKEPE